LFIEQQYEYKMDELFDVDVRTMTFFPESDLRNTRMVEGNSKPNIQVYNVGTQTKYEEAGRSC
jgi:hypothetical protein